MAGDNIHPTRRQSLMSSKTVRRVRTLFSLRKSKHEDGSSQPTPPATSHYHTHTTVASSSGSALNSSIQCPPLQVKPSLSSHTAIESTVHLSDASILPFSVKSPSLLSNHLSLGQLSLAHSVYPTRLEQADTSTQDRVVPLHLRDDVPVSARPGGSPSHSLLGGDNPPAESQEVSPVGSIPSPDSHRPLSAVFQDTSPVIPGSQEDLDFEPTLPTMATIVAEPEAMDVDEVEIQAIPRTSSASALVLQNQDIPLELIEGSPVQPIAADLVCCIKGMYRILDLVSEQGSGGLVDKIIISQDSFGCFMNDLVPGAYASMTQVDFVALDQVLVNPVGIYGSKSQIVEFLHDLDVVDDRIADLLRIPGDDAISSGTPILRSGLYFLRSQTDFVMYVIYWPQDTTWDDTAISSVVRNRVTFMRYLTKIADQLISMIPDDHSANIVWSNQTGDAPMEFEDDETDRFTIFHVAKTKEQEEDVAIRPGFKVNTPEPPACELPDDYEVDIEQFQPRLVPGETASGYMTTSFEASQRYNTAIQEKYTDRMLQVLLTNGSFRLSKDLSEEALQRLLPILSSPAVTSRVGEPLLILKKDREQALEEVNRDKVEKLASMKTEIGRQRPTLVSNLREGLADIVLSGFRHFDRPTLIGELPADAAPRNTDLLPHLFRLYPHSGLEHEWNDIRRQFPMKISRKQFSQKKEILLSLEHAFQEQPELGEAEQQKILESILRDNEQAPQTSRVVGVFKSVIALTPFGGSSGDTSCLTQNKEDGVEKPQCGNASTDDVSFFNRLPSLTAEFPILSGIAMNIKQLAHEYFRDHIFRRADEFAQRMEKTQMDISSRQICCEADRVISEKRRSTRLNFLSAIKATFINNIDYVLYVRDVEEIQRWWIDSASQYIIHGFREETTAPSLKHTVFVFKLTESDAHEMQLNPSMIPSPRVHPSSSFFFNLPLGHRVLLLQLLDRDRCLLVIQNPKGAILVFLDQYRAIARAVEENHSKKALHHDKIGKDFILAFDETKRMLVVCAVEKYMLHVFIFDEKFSTLQGLGMPIDLNSWYSDGQTKIVLATLICGTSEDLILVDDGGCARIYSFTTQQFRPASVQLQSVPHALYSSPDAACIFTFEQDTEGHYLRAYHWSNYGRTNGISLSLPGFPIDSLVMTSFGSRSRVFFVGLDNSRRLCTSAALDITSRVTEFTFQEQRSQVSRVKAECVTAHNSLIDCHADVWTRFPVVPAVQRRTIKSSSGRLPRSITFVSSHNPSTFQSHFANLIDTFERTTRKPTETELSSIRIHGTTYGAFMKQRAQDVSAFKAGEWLVDLLCLIPIHIAVTRDNRFIPLKDGVMSAQVERDLLGATVDQIIDGLSFGWYESIFQSYMASKPVKVVSSMGEQSVGKSFALNHLVDTSFAGSAMRTTEGVWMSVTPTDDTLIVALDFEGVHSIERSAQEDSLLVLFNTAMSNLVLFRNNFALSRDITGLFQSFQSSSTILDPAANPSLFQSTLVIIIKDVVDSDKAEITKQFSLKFQRIVELEQGSNFITMLHAGNLAIIPWPVIESRQFYTLFPRVKKLLDNQKVTHSKAATFLQTMKTMMAKLKVNDWGSLDQNLASHRAQQLGGLLLCAMRYGLLEQGQGADPLKVFDSGRPIDMPDSAAVFFLSHDDVEKPDEQEEHLQDLLQSWENYNIRLDKQEDIWLQDLVNHLDNLANNRVEHVREWLEANTIRFKSDVTEFEALRREFGKLSVALRGSVRLCKLQCSLCQLSCLQIRHHEGPHDCRTSHTCHLNCQYVDEHESGIEEPCGLPAGHEGNHICDISAHLCGKPCILSGKGGCLGHCSKVLGHSDLEHLCPAVNHECNEPCSLANILLPDGSHYTCRDNCRIPTNQPHDKHLCDNRSCPLPCQMCKRLCSSSNHLHAFETDAHHLCGQEHPCPGTCQSKGICRIETAPQSMEAIFTGRHETFQYTKYTQVSKRLPCAIPIPAGDLTHSGNHVHSTDKGDFHFCEKRCDYCGYFCTLPLGHPQNEHETSHGSMSRTSWAIEGPEGTALEVDGRKFGSHDNGAPMLCSMICRSMGRHIHVDSCRSENPQACSGADIQHIPSAMIPDPQKPKDFISHSLYWGRAGFKDPYSAEDRTAFSKCDSMCAGTEHLGDANTPAHPSYCNLPLFHRPHSAGEAPPGGVGYISADGHHYSCRNPALMQQAFHVIFVVDRSSSMSNNDRRPRPNTPVSRVISTPHNNRLGAVFQSLHGFWQARDSAINSSSAGIINRRDAYSVVLFDRTTHTAIENDFSSSPDILLNNILRFDTGRGTKFTGALQAAQEVMERNWSTERAPVIIFLSDGEANVTDEIMRDLCRRSSALGRPLSFHTVSFGPFSRTLRQMTNVAREAQRSTRADPMHPTVPSSYTNAIDTIQLAETFLGFAESLRKPRGSLVTHG